MTVLDRRREVDLPLPVLSLHCSTLPTDRYRRPHGPRHMGDMVRAARWAKVRVSGLVPPRAYPRQAVAPGLPVGSALRARARGSRQRLSGGVTAHAFLSPGPAQLVERQSPETRRMMGMRQQPSACILAEETRVDG